jgi:hypothetical protein
MYTAAANSHGQLLVENCMKDLTLSYIQIV